MVMNIGNLYAPLGPLVLLRFLTSVSTASSNTLLQPNDQPPAPKHKTLVRDWRSYQNPPLWLTVPTSARANLKKTMKTKKHNLANEEVTEVTRIKHLGSFERKARAFGRIAGQGHLRLKTLPLYFAVYLGLVFFTLVPLTLAHGNSGGHSSMMGGHGNEGHNVHRGHIDPFWTPSFFYHPGIYDSAYCYTPTPPQQAAAKQQLQAYLQGVKKNRQPAATHRYVSVETLRPTKKQLNDLRGKQPARPIESAQLHCLMVFDTQTKESVGSGCYIVTGEPLTGQVAQFESVSAEFVGQ
jgi:hypothetical protein